MEFIKLEDCVARGIYRIHSRNLVVGVFDGEKHFYGIREKFGNYYVDMEDHCEFGTPFGTVKPLEFIGMLPQDIEIRKNTDSLCTLHHRPTYWKPNNDGSYMGKWYHADDDSPMEEDDHSYVETYKPLFDYLNEIERKLQLEGNSFYTGKNRPHPVQ